METPSVDLKRFPPRLQTLIEKELIEGEKIIHVEQPLPLQFGMLGIERFASLIRLFAVGVFFLILFTNDKNIDNKGMLLVPIGLFLCYSLWILSTPVRLFSTAKQMAYTITNRQVIIFIASRKASIRSIKLNTITYMRRQQSKDESGDLIFDESSPKPDSSDFPNITNGLYAMLDVKKTEYIIRNLVGDFNSTSQGEIPK